MNWKEKQSQDRQDIEDIRVIAKMLDIENHILEHKLTIAIESLRKRINEFSRKWHSRQQFYGSRTCEIFQNCAQKWMILTKG